MPADLDEKTDRYETMLVDALGAVETAVAPGSPLEELGTECEQMASSYLADGRHFRDENDPVNALVAFSYGYGWLDAAVRMGLFTIDEHPELFTTQPGRSDE
jgi:Uncharacterized protein conserved in archaea